MEDGYVTEVRVRWSECDPLGIALFSKYLEWFDLVGLTEFLRGKGLTFNRAGEMLCDGKPTGVAITIVKVICEYYRPAFFDDLLKVSVKMRELGENSMSFDYEALRGEKLLAKAQMTYVFIDAKEKKAVKIPKEVRERLSST
jgi:acyl-CoA thioester hydrolase